ncbi:hypothetical protein LG301_10670 [Vreelandella venusta]|uniref:hypothetical protein n=1 Tax=Vreelandella venusta TaxID=44935 RepID=UPI00384B1C2A
MGNYNYSASLSDPDIPDTLTKEQVMMLLDRVIKEAFFELYERAFGAPDDATTAKVEKADLLTGSSQWHFCSAFPSPRVCYYPLLSCPGQVVHYAESSCFS